MENECSGFLISDFETGEVLEGKNMDKVFPMASISKIMTYIVVKDMGRLSGMVGKCP